jgi:threonine dehydratase
VKLVAEGAGAAPVAALLAGKVPGSGSVCCLLSGGNIDASLLAQVARYGLTRAGRHLVVRTRVLDTPGQLARLLTLLADDRVNVIEVGHLREGLELPVTATGIELTLLTRDHAHCADVIRRMREWGYPTERVR